MFDLRANPAFSALPSAKFPMPKATPAVPSFFDSRQLLHRPCRDFHEGFWTKHAEVAVRAQNILEHLEWVLDPVDMGIGPLLAVHSADYLDFLQSAYQQWQAAGLGAETIPLSWPVVGRRQMDLARIHAKVGRYSTDLITPIGERTWEAAYWSAQTALSATDRILHQGDRAVFALCRPPGHHAGRDYCGGYCYLNNAAISAAHAVSAGRRVAVLDVDDHHGNGTQDIFYEDAEVMVVSIHADPVTSFPYFWGRPDETGAGKGRGKNLNLPLPKGSSSTTYFETVDRALLAVHRHRPDLMIVSLGLDTFVDDPVADFCLTTDDFRQIGIKIAAVELPVLAVLEGGYALDALGHNVASFLLGLKQ